MKVDIGCGAKKKEGFYGLDYKPFPGVDKVTDFDKEPLPIPDSSADEVYCSHCLEHVRNPESLLSEITRILKPGGLFWLRVPYWSSREAFYFNHLFYFSELSLEPALKKRGFSDIKFSYGWTSAIQNPSNPFHAFWKRDHKWALMHLINVAWEIQAHCVWQPIPKKP